MGTSGYLIAASNGLSVAWRPRIVSAMVPERPDPVCPVCAQLIQSGSLVRFERGTFFHARCRNREPPPAIRATSDAAMRWRRDRPAELSMRRGACPVCRHRATVIDWRPLVSWLTVEDCPCSGVFVWTSLLEARLPNL